MMADLLKWPDYLIFILFLIVSLGIGVYHAFTGGRQKTTQEFIMANRKLQVIPTTISLLVSFQSAIGTLGAPAEIYTYGTQFHFLNPMSAVLGIIVAERFLIPWLYPLKLVSINEYLERRYESKAVKIFGMWLSVLTAILFMGVAMYAPSIALESATGFPVNVSIPLMAIVSIAYTALGGMRAVIWTDVFQFFIMVGGSLAILIKGILIVGGWNEMMRLAGEEGRLIWVDWSLNPTVRHTFWTFFFGLSVQWVATYGVFQTACQRYSATETLGKARRTLLINIPGVILMYGFNLFTGIAVFAYYAHIKCDPLVNKNVRNSNQIISHYVPAIFVNNPGFAGLFLATLYGGSLSTISSSLSGAAANVWQDVLRHKLGHWPESRKTLVNKALVVLFGIVSAGFAFFATVVPGPIIQILLSFAGIVIGPTLGLFLLGGISKHGNWKGALFGGLASSIFFVGLKACSFTVKRRPPTLPPVSTAGCFPRYNNTMFGLQTPNMTNLMRPTLPPLSGADSFFSLSYLWYVTFSCITTVLLGLAFSFIFRDREAESRVEDRMLIPWKQSLSCSEVFTCSNQLEQFDSNDKFYENENEILYQKFLCESGDVLFKEALLNGNARETALLNDNARESDV